MLENEYQITQINEMTILDEAGNPVEGYRIYFTWGLGRRAHIDLSKERASKEVRDALIAAEIERQEMLWG